MDNVQILSCKNCGLKIRYQVVKRDGSREAEPVRVRKLTPGVVYVVATGSDDVLYCPRCHFPERVSP